jgi:hypothetical protein
MSLYSKESKDDQGGEGAVEGESVWRSKEAKVEGSHDGSFDL